MNSTPLLYFLLALSSLTFAIFHSRAVSTGEARNLSWNADKAGEAPPEHLQEWSIFVLFEIFSNIVW